MKIKYNRYIKANEKLDIIQKHLEEEFFFTDIDVEDLYHEEKDAIIRAFTFSQGEREEVVVIGDNYHIYYHEHITEKDIEPNLIKKICSSLLLLKLEREKLQ